MKHKAKLASDRTKGRVLRQVGALPVRLSDAGAPEILLVTSRDTGRWVIPKGGLVKGLDAAASAALEAWEEAGIVGEIQRQAVGFYVYDKVLADGRSRSALVTVFRMDVAGLRDDWPEKGQRRRCWMRPAEAAAQVAEPDLAALMAALA